MVGWLAGCFRLFVVVKSFSPLRHTQSLKHRLPDCNDGCETSHSLASSAEVMHAWSYSSTPPYVLIVSCVTKHGHDMSFFLDYVDTWSIPNLMTFHSMFQSVTFLVCLSCHRRKSEVPRECGLSDKNTLTVRAGTCLFSSGTLRDQCWWPMIVFSICMEYGVLRRRSKSFDFTLALL